MLRTVYIETTVISYLAARPSRDLITAAHQTVTHEWWNGRGRFRLMTSQAVIEEAGSGDPLAAQRRLGLLAGIPVYLVTPDAIELADRIAAAIQLPTRSRVDALHVAVAATQKAEFLLTWNCRHLANGAHRARIEYMCRQAGCVPPTICTPLELPEA